MRYEAMGRGDIFKLLLAISLLAAAALLLADAFAPPAPVAGWDEAASRIERRLGASEMVLIHRAGRVVEAGPLRGVPLLCDEGGRNSPLARLGPGGIWAVGDEQLTGPLSSIFGAFAQRGTIAFGPVFMRHHWERREPEGRR